jgi:alkanesulfonate monooxygenase SsuD/methylene tetrahydromethanopterin reductase-like flavin-dependent oxidoreductase (luciferase family)
MDIAVTLPMRAMDGEELLAWGRAAEAGPFSGLSHGERVCYENHDPLIAHAVLAGATKRIRFTTGVNVLPIQNEVIFAKQCASLERLSGGRFVLGIGVGPREADFAATRSDWKTKARRFEEQFAAMKRVWNGEAPYPGADPVGPPTIRPGGPEIHIGGFVDAALRRAGRLADGLRSFDFAPDPAIHLQRYAVAAGAWEEAGRPGRLKLIASTYFSLGPDARAVYDRSMQEYYGYADDMVAWSDEPTALVTPQAIADAIKRFEDAGVDEMGFAAAAFQGPESVDRLAEAVALAHP